MTDGHRKPTDFELLLRGAITAEEYVRRLRQRAAERIAQRAMQIKGER